MSPRLSRTAALVLFVAAGSGALLLATRTLTAFLPSIALPLSDYVSVFTRYLELEEGRLGFLSYVFQKHGDHNHAAGYFLAFVDIVLDDGRMRLLHAFQLASNVAAFALVSHAGWQLNRSLVIRGLLLLFIASQIFAVRGFEIWVFPFQVVLASFRVLLVAGLLLLCLEVVGRPRRAVVAASIAILLLSALSHGSGYLVCAAAIVVCAVWGRREHLAMAAVLLALFVANEMAHPPSTSLTELLRRVPPSEWARLPVYTAYLLGNAVAWGVPKPAQVVVGILGILLWAWTFRTVVVGMRGHARPYAVFCLALSTLFLGAAALSVVLNLSYVEIRRVEVPPPLEYFLSSRYNIATSGFWTGLAALALSGAGFRSRWVLGAAFTASALGAIQNWESEKAYWSRWVALQKIYEVAISSDAWKSLPESEACRILMIPDGYPHQHVLEGQRRLRLGPYAPGLGEENRALALGSAADLTDENWDRGVSRHGAAIVLINLPENASRFVAGRRVQLGGGGIRRISQAGGSGLWLNVTLEGALLDPGSDGYPNRLTLLD